MALFNKLKNEPVKTHNIAGGKAYLQDPKMALVSVLLTSFVHNQFYRSAKETQEGLAKLVNLVDPIFAAKAAIFARNEFGMRSVSHVVAAELAEGLSGKPWAKDFYESVVYRPDDMTEILAYYYSNKGKTITNAMRKGFSKAFDKFDGYQLAKYKGQKRAIKLIDVVNLVHPLPTKRNSKALNLLVKGELRSFDTWESKLSEAGQKAETAEDKAQLKEEAWKELIENRKIGYFTLLRNIRNIADQAPEVIHQALAILTDPHAIKASKVLPFRFLTAMEVISVSKLKGERKILRALEKAIDIAVDNVPELPGRTLVVLDDSSSMTWQNGRMVTPIKIGALFAAALYKKNDADLMRFSNDASYVKIYFNDSTFSISQHLIKRAKAGGTNFHSIFKRAKRPYDRIIILSDMQGWVGYETPATSLLEYNKKFDVNPFVYSFDLQGYGTFQFPGNKVYAIAGYSDKVFDFMKILEQDKKALINKIEAVEL